MTAAGSSSAEATDEPADAEELAALKARKSQANRASYLNRKASAAMEAATAVVGGVGSAASAFARTLGGKARETAHAIECAKSRAVQTVYSALERFSPHKQAEVLDALHDKPELAVANALRTKQPATEEQLTDSARSQATTRSRYDCPRSRRNRRRRLGHCACLTTSTRRSWTCCSRETLRHERTPGTAHAPRALVNYTKESLVTRLLRH